MPQLQWSHSYETLKFDTEDGDIHKGQYARYKGGYIVRDVPENNDQFKHIPSTDDRGNPVDIDLTGLTEVKVLDGEHMYYDIFVLPNGRKYRVPSNKVSYGLLAVKGALPPFKVVSTSDVNKITKEDTSWQ